LRFACAFECAVQIATLISLADKHNHFSDACCDLRPEDLQSRDFQSCIQYFLSWLPLALAWPRVAAINGQLVLRLPLCSPLDHGTSMHVLELSDDVILSVFQLLTPFHRDAWLASAPTFMEPDPVRTFNVDERKDAYPLRGPRDLAFTQVCRSWRSAALADARLWSFVDFRRPPVVLEMLRRVGDAPVDIRWDEAAPSSTQTLGHIGRHLSTVRMLYIEGPLDYSPLLDFLFGGSTPSPDGLKALRMRITDYADEPENIFPLHSFLLRGPGPLNLTRLELHFLSTTVQYDALFSVLDASPGLVHLSVRSALSNQPIPTSWIRNHGVIRLRHLRHLVFAEMPPVFLAVFPLLELPSICSVTSTHLSDDSDLNVEDRLVMEDSSPAEEELRSTSTMFKHLSVECRALSFRETCYETMDEGLTFYAWATNHGHHSSESSVLEVLDAHPEWDYLPLNLDEGIQLVLHNLSVANVTYLEVCGMNINMLAANLVTSHPPSVTDWVDILRAMPLLGCILVTEYPARTLLEALTNDFEGILGATLHTLIMKHAFRQPYRSSPTSAILETALRARERMGHAIPLVKLHRCAVDVLAFEAAASRWELCTRVIRIDDEKLHFPPKGELLRAAGERA
jgi:hypothetical protein